MKQINLLPQELRVREVQHRTIPFILIAFFAGVVAVVIPWLGLKGMKDNLAEQVQQREVALGLAPTKNEQAQAAQAAKEQADITNRITILNSLATQEVNWSKVFDLVGSSVPKDIVLSSYGVTNSATGLVVQLGGVAPTNVSFASFVESIKSNTHITKMVVDGFVFDPGKGTVSFSVSLTVKPGDVLYQKSTL